LALFIAGKDFLHPVGFKVKFSGARPQEVRIVKPVLCTRGNFIVELVRVYLYVSIYGYFYMENNIPFPRKENSRHIIQRVLI
jgi:hypothetical protein